MKIFLVKLVLIFLISLPVAILCKRWDSSIKPLVLVIFAISALCVNFLIDVLEKKIFHPKVIVSAEKKEKEILITANTSKPLSSLAINFPVLGKIKNVHDNNSVTDGKTTIRRIVGSNTPVSQNNIELYIEDMKPSVKLEYKIIYEPMPIKIVVAGTDRYKISYTWQYSGGSNTESKWISIETGQEVTAPNVTISGFTFHNKALSPEEIKKSYEEGLKKRNLE